MESSNRDVEIKTIKGMSPMQLTTMVASTGYADPRDAIGKRKSFGVDKPKPKKAAKRFDVDARAKKRKQAAKSRARNRR